jgi:hypothetical protein
MNVMINMRKQASQFNSLLSSGDGPNVFASDRKVRLGDPGVSCATEPKLLLMGRGFFPLFRQHLSGGKHKMSRIQNDYI